MSASVENRKADTRKQKRPPAILRTSEAAFQAAVVELLGYTLAPGAIFYHVPNGEKRSAATGAKLKRMGVKPGVADLALVLPGGRAAFLELKADGGKLSKEQGEFCKLAARAGAPYAVARSLDDVTKILGAWGALRVSARAA